MAVIRVHKTRDYTVMSNHHLREREMSLKAKGLLSQMLSLPEDWNYTVAGLVAINRESESAITAALNELKRFGYLVVTKRLPNETQSGRLEYEYDIYECPKGQTRSVQGGEKQGVENQGLENQGVENRGQLNTNISNTDNKKKDNKTLSERFETLWELYPRKQGKAAARKAYERAIKAGVTDEAILNGIKNYIGYINGQRIEARYIKQGSTWFNGRCWEDSYGQTERRTDLDNIF